ncbi:MAG: nuclear transport factor 2 family protein [bacterium]|nr:nuclear transport factor 2 family protein [bacterium]
MAKESSSETKAIKGIVRAISDHWKLKDYEGIGSYLADDVVTARPGSDDRIRGRDAYVQSYRDYDQSAETLEYSAGDPKVDVVGDTAVAVCPFEVKYKHQGTMHHERGNNILVFSLSHDRWKIVWRTMQVVVVGEGND